MRAALWVLNRLSAAIVGAVAVGCLAGALLTPIEIFTGSKDYRDLPGALLFLAVCGVMYAVALGVVPGAAVLFISRARYRPWRSLPLLVSGTVVGFLIAFCISLLMHGTYETEFVPVYIVAPTLGGILASLFIRRRIVAAV